MQLLAPPLLVVVLLAQYVITTAISPHHEVINEHSKSFQESVVNPTTRVLNDPSINAASVPTRPTTAPGITAMRLVVLDLYYDRFPSETSWILLNKRNQTLGTKPSIAGILSSYASTSFALTSGEKYVWQITDSEGDGMCCRFGFGYYAVRAVVNGKNVFLAGGYGDFGARVEVPFIVPFNALPAPHQPSPKPMQKPVPTVAPNPIMPSPVHRPNTAPATSSQLVTLDLLYDEYPRQTSWLLLDKTLRVIGQSSAILPLPNSWTASSFILAHGEQYTWRILDRNGLGLYGLYMVETIINGNNIILAQGSGNFTTGIDVSFVVPHRPTRKPTEA